MKTRFSKISILLVLFVLTLIPLMASAQTYSNTDDADAAAGCAICGGFTIVFIGIFVVALAVGIALAVWVYKDAKSRGDNPILWLLVVLFFSVPGLIVYLLARTKGDLVDCPKCGKKKLATMEFCPHCEGDLAQQGPPPM